MSSSTKALMVRTLAGIAVIAFLFSAVLALQLILTYRMMQTEDPLNNAIIEGRVRQLEEDPGNAELKKTIRELDHHTRSAFFHSRQRLTVGLKLLIIGLGILIVSGAAAYRLGRKPPMPAACAGTGENEFREARHGRLFVAAVAVMFVFMTGAIVMFMPDGLEENLGVKQEPVPTDDRPKPQPVPADAPLPSAEELKAQWVAFRGWQGGAVCTDCRPVTECDVRTGKNILWKTEIPAPGYSSPIVWKDRVFVTGGTAAKRELFCFDADTGKLRWAYADEGGQDSSTEALRVDDNTGYAAATATTDGVRVYAVFATGDLICCNMDGRQVWRMDLGVPAISYGYSSSPIMCGRLLIVQFYHKEESVIFAFDGATGDMVWEIDRDPDPSWSSPVLMSMDDKQLLLVNSSSDIRAYDPQTGKELWKNDCLGDEVGPSPAYSGTTVFAAQANVALTAINAATGESLWDTANVDLPDVASPLATGKRLYLVSSGLYISCVNPADGELKWEQEVDDMCYSSPILAGENIYLFDMEGTMYVFKDSDTFTLIKKSNLNETVVATPAFVKDRIYVRGNEHLFCIGKKN
ncbi:PQQ-binding-like beta-propeller repeat protein [Planctomycetota bacterium]